MDLKKIRSRPMGKSINKYKLKVATITFLSLSGLSSIIVASFWWEGLNERDTIDIIFSETETLRPETYESLINEIIDDSTENNKIIKTVNNIKTITCPIYKSSHNFLGSRIPAILQAC